MSEFLALFLTYLLKAVDAEMDLVVCITEGIPQKDMVMAKNHMKGSNTRLIGKSCNAIILELLQQRRHAMFLGFACEVT